MLTIQRTENAGTDQYRAQPPRDSDIESAIRDLLGGRSNYEAFQRNGNLLVVKYRPLTLGSPAHTLVTYRDESSDELIDVLWRIMQAIDEYVTCTRDQLIGEMITADGQSVQDLRPSEIRTISARFSTSPLRIMALTKALGLPQRWDTLAQYDNYGKFDDFVTLAIMAYRDESTLEEVMATLSA